MLFLSSGHNKQHKTSCNTQHKQAQKSKKKLPFFLFCGRFLRPPLFKRNFCKFFEKCLLVYKIVVLLPSSKQGNVLENAVLRRDDLADPVHAVYVLSHGAQT